jgi:inner membrane protein
MNRVIHSTFGIIIGAVLYYYYFPFYMTIPISIIGSVFPDIDRPKKWFFGSIMKHRGWIHSLLAMIIFTVILKLMFLQIGVYYELELVFTAGYFSHLFLDAFTPMGVMMFYPLKKRI